MVRILAGGNRSGKSEANAAEKAAAALGYRPWVLRELGLPMPEKPWVRPSNLPEEAIVFNGAGIRIQIPSDQFIVSGLPMKKGIGEIMHPKLKKLLGPLIEREWMAHANVPSKIRIKNGVEIHYGSDEQDVMAFEGTNYSDVGVDEPIKRRIYTAIRRGTVDQFARVTMTFTPIGRNAAWIFKDLYQERDRRKVEVFNISIFDNPYLSPEAVQEFVTDPTLSELEKQARLYGRFMHLSDRIYATFAEEVHVIEPFKVPYDWFVGMVVDPATVKPFFIAYFTISPRGDIYFFKEWPTGDFTKIRRDTRSPAEYANLIRSLDADLPIQARLMDPNYGPRSDTVRGVYVPSLRDELGRYGLPFDCQIEDDLAYGEAKVRNLLAYDPSTPLSSLNRPRLYFTTDCPNLISSMLYYSFKLRPQSEEPDEEKREENYKDGADCVRYVAVKFSESAPTEPFGDPYDIGETDISAYGESE